jgi:hypothetical protein
VSTENPQGADHAGPIEATNQTRHHPFFYIGGVFLNAVVFAAIGPLVGGVTLWTLLLAEGSILASLFGPLLYILGFFKSIPESYRLAGFAPALTGAIVAVASIWLTHSRSLYVFAASTGGVTSSMLISPEAFTSGNPFWAYVVLFVSGALAAIVCTRVARPFRLGVPAGPALVTSLPVENR